MLIPIHKAHYVAGGGLEIPGVVSIDMVLAFMYEHAGEVYDECGDVYLNKAVSVSVLRAWLEAQR